MGAVVVLFLFAVVGAVAGAYKYGTNFCFFLSNPSKYTSFHPFLGYLDPYVEQLQQAMGQKSGN